MSISLSADQIDALKEIVNIAIGQAGDSLARVLDCFVTLSVPNSQLIQAADIGKCMRQLLSSTPEISAVRQSFNDDLRGEAIVIFSSAGCSTLADLMGYDGKFDPRTQHEILLDVSNILIGACLNGIAQQLDAELSFSPPTIIAEKTPPENLMQADNIHWKSALWLSVEFQIAQRDFRTQLLIMMPDEAINKVSASLNDYIDAI